MRNLKARTRLDLDLDLDHTRDGLREHLLKDVVAFWTRHAIDPAGGLNTCIDDTGRVLSRDKWLWSQWRAVWVFSRLYQTIEPRDDWLCLARSIARFVIDHGWLPEQQGWALCLDADGRVLRGHESLYVDGFAIYGLTQLAAATGEQEPLEWARRTADAACRRLRRPHHELPAFPYPIEEGVRVHGLPMIFSLALWELGQQTDEPQYRNAAAGMSGEVFERFYRPQRDLVLERIAEDGSELPAPRGTAVVPGHVIEDMWFQVHIARDRDDRETIKLATRLIRRHLELGWDERYGGLLLAIDADGREPVGWDFADTKLWWPQTEALYASLLAYELTAEPWCLDWFRRVHGYCREHYPVAEHGEWRQRLDRRGRPLEEVIALPVKDPFHLPRALILSIECLERIIQGRSGSGDASTA